RAASRRRDGAAYGRRRFDRRHRKRTGRPAGRRGEGMSVSGRSLLLLAPAVVLACQLLERIRVELEIRILDHHQPLGVLRVVLARQGVAYDPGLLFEGEA